VNPDLRPKRALHKPGRGQSHNHLGKPKSLSFRFLLLASSSLHGELKKPFCLIGKKV